MKKATTLAAFSFLFLGYSSLGWSSPTKAQLPKLGCYYNEESKETKTKRGKWEKMSDEQRAQAEEDDMVWPPQESFLMIMKKPDGGIKGAFGITAAGHYCGGTLEGSEGKDGYLFKNSEDATSPCVLKVSAKSDGTVSLDTDESLEKCGETFGCGARIGYPSALFDKKSFRKDPSICTKNNSLSPDDTWMK